MEQDQLSQAIGDAAIAAVAGDDESVVIGDHITVVETMAEHDQGLVILAPYLTPAHVSLLARAIDHLVARFVPAPATDSVEMEGEADAA